MYPILLSTHLLAATIWTGGHLILALTILPEALRKNAVEDILRFERYYAKVGLPALIIQVLSGIGLAQYLLPDHTQWFTFENDVSTIVGTKLTLLLLTIGIAAHMHHRLLPRLSPHNLRSAAIHISLVTLISVCFPIVGAILHNRWFFWN